MTIPKRRKIRHKWPKFFGWPDEKWAKGGKQYGYGRAYGKNKHGNHVDHRTRAERLNREGIRSDEDEDRDAAQDWASP